MKKIWITWEYHLRGWEDPRYCSVCDEEIFFHELIIRADNNNIAHIDCSKKIHIESYISEVFPDTKLSENIIFPLPFS